MNFGFLPVTALARSTIFLTVLSITDFFWKLSCALNDEYGILSPEMSASHMSQNQPVAMLSGNGREASFVAQIASHSAICFLEYFFLASIVRLYVMYSGVSNTNHSPSDSLKFSMPGIYSTYLYPMFLANCNDSLGDVAAHEP